MKKMINCILVSLSAFIITAHAAPTSKDATVVTEDKPAIMLSSHDTQFVIKLKSNPTTGYRWFLRGYDKHLFQPVKHVYQAPVTDKKLMGAPGYELWTFHVNADAFVVPQQSQIRFIYSRPWDAMDQSKQLVFKVTTAR